jgi:ketosteroid isomerase-like protein
MPVDRKEIVKECYRAYVSGDRALIEPHLSEDLVFYSPADPGIDLETYFERCWPNAELIANFQFTRLIEAGEEILVTYESTRTDGSRFRNTEVMTFAGEKITQVEVYFGWNLP